MTFKVLNALVFSDPLGVLNKSENKLANAEKRS